MHDDELLRLDYEQTTQLVRALTEIRFKLLAFVPTIAGATVAFLSDPTSAAQLVAVGLLGLAATLGIFMYELGNIQAYDAAVHRAQVLERRLGIGSIGGEAGAGGVFSEPRERTQRLFGRLEVRHDRALAFVYAAALAGWSYLAAWGLLALAGVPSSQWGGAVVGAGVAILVLAHVERLGRELDEGLHATAEADPRIRTPA
jgi:hypothetical protein